MSLRSNESNFQPLSREVLLARGRCCDNGCKNCPYTRENSAKEKEKMTTPECREWDSSVGPVPEVFEQDIYSDHRGIFTELWQRERLHVPHKIGQINHSTSVSNTIRGMHWQVNPYAVGKFVTCLRGSVDDVVVDLRKRSKTFGQWKSYFLAGMSWGKKRSSVWVPPGFAHGFLVTSKDGADVVYLQDGLWVKEAERSLRWDDPDVGINWLAREYVMGEDCPFVVSDKDSNASFLKDLTDDDLFL